MEWGTVLYDHSFVIAGEMLIFNLTLYLLIRPKFLIKEPKTLKGKNNLQLAGTISLILLLLWSMWTGHVLLALKQ